MSTVKSGFTPNICPHLFRCPSFGFSYFRGIGTSFFLTLNCITSTRSKTIESGCAHAIFGGTQPYGEPSPKTPPLPSPIPVPLSHINAGIRVSNTASVTCNVSASRAASTIAMRSSLRQQRYPCNSCGVSPAVFTLFILLLHQHAKFPRRFWPITEAA